MCFLFYSLYPPPDIKYSLPTPILKLDRKFENWNSNHSNDEKKSIVNICCVINAVTTQWSIFTKGENILILHSDIPGVPEKKNLDDVLEKKTLISYKSLF